MPVLRFRCMDSDHRETDDRLRHRLNADQAGRERLCAAILALDRRYTQIESRRPEGGPDGGRDLQAVLDAKTQVWGAVGFQNSVSDSPQDKRQAKNKFRDDIASALRSNPDLAAFVFFTNVDLTEADLEEMRSYAASAGLKQVDIYWRERIRHVLDSPQGLALRYQYLKVPLSAAEQATFFSNYGTQLQEIIVNQHEQVQEGVRRLEFLHWMARPIREIGLAIHLDRFYESDELQHFRAVAKLFHTPESDTAWYIGGTDRYQPHADGEGASVGTRAIFSAADPPKLTFVQRNVYLHHHGLASMYFGAALAHNIVPAPTPEVLEGRLVTLFVTQNLSQKIKSAFLVLNGYRVASWTTPAFTQQDFKVEWPEPVYAADKDTRWVGSSFFPPTIDFARTPPKHR